MLITMYTDRLVNIGYITPEWWKEWTDANGNMIDVDVPSDILKSYYLKKLADKYDYMPFIKWYYEESVAYDMDDLFEFTDWRPYLVDIKEWK